MKPTLTLLAEAVVAADVIRMQMLELEHTINQIHASRGFKSLDEGAEYYLGAATEILRSDLPGGIERIRNLIDKAAFEENHTRWLSIYDEMSEMKNSCLSKVWSCDIEMMKKAFLAVEVFENVWEQVDLQLEMDPDVIAIFRREFVRRFDWNSVGPASAQYHSLYDQLLNYLDCYRDTRHREKNSESNSADVAQ